MRVFSQIKDRKHIEQNVHSVARVMPRDGTCGCCVESKTLAWGFAIAPYRLCALVVFYAQGPLAYCTENKHDLILDIVLPSWAS